jgi:hypothetical protein
MRSCGSATPNLDEFDGQRPAFVVNPEAYAARHDDSAMN